MDFVSKYRALIGFVLILIMMGSGIFLVTKPKESDPGITISDSDTQKNDQAESQFIFADIEGAVKKPGVYKLKDGSILEDLIIAAGGFVKNVDSGLTAQTVNRAQKLKDGDKFYIPIKGDAVSEQAARGGVTLDQDYGTVAGATTGKININTANQNQLESLPGIGPSKAAAIIGYRNANGAFKSIESIKNVQGIGDATYANIKDLIIV
jgi:competence protein ComEA